jgi:hypothetical protein
LEQFQEEVNWMLRFLRWYASLLTPDAAEKRRRDSIARSVQRGWVNQCQDCLSIMPKHLAYCSKCGGPPKPGMSRQTQMIRHYTKGDIIKAFRKEAEFLAQYGWRIQSQSYGGEQGGLKTSIGVGPVSFDLSSEKRPTEIIVTYAR